MAFSLSKSRGGVGSCSVRSRGWDHRAHHCASALRGLNDNVSNGCANSIADCTYSEAWQIRTQQGHHAAICYYKHLLSNNVQDTSAATRIAASKNSLKVLDQVGRPHVSSIDWENDISKLKDILDQSQYNHSAMREFIFNLPVGLSLQETTLEAESSFERYKNNYPFGPIYARSLRPGQHLDVQSLLNDTQETWKLSLKCLTILFVLAGCIPKSVFLRVIIGGNETLDLLLRLGLVFLSEEEEDLVVPTVSLFPMDIPALIPPATKDVTNDQARNGRSLVIMTDMHPNVLGLTSISEGKSEDGTVMYIGPDSLALVHHLHASFMQYIMSSRASNNDGHDDDTQFRLLDFCTGSGIQALATIAMLELHSGTNIIAAAVDVNQRALRFTEFNALLNGFGVSSSKKDIGSNENDNKTKTICTVHADLIKRKVLSSKEDTCFISELLSLGSCTDRTMFDLVLANPPFIPTPSKVSDARVLSVYGSAGNDTTNVPIYGLFSTGGEDGEVCLRAIVNMTPSLLKQDGLAAIVSEFMNPPESHLFALDTDVQEENISHKIGDWWGQSHGQVPSGILCTNEYPLDSTTYAERRAIPNDFDDIQLWKDHLEEQNIHSVSPGLLFLRHDDAETQRSTIDHRLIPKTIYGSIWTPQNFRAIDFVRNGLLDILPTS